MSLQPTTPRPHDALRIGAIILQVACLAACHGGRPEPRAPNVVLIVLDTVRADHLGCYGYARDTSPEIDAFAATATRFARAVSSAPWTVPSHASMFTGKPPFEHGAHTFDAQGPGKNVNPLSEDQLTLAEALETEGFRTGAFVANVGFLAPHWQLDQGFQTYRVERLPAAELNPLIFEWLAEADGPFFLFINYIDAHRPYNTRPRPGFLDPPASRDRRLLDRLIEAVLPGRDPVPQALAQQVIDQYDTAIANLDEQVGRLLDVLEQSGQADQTLVVVTSDHGEYFGEHHLVEHSKDVYQPVLDVPLLIREPGQRAGEVVDTLVVSNDLPHLILSSFPAGPRERLLPLFSSPPGEHSVLAENYYTRRKDLEDERWGHRFRRVRRAVFDWPYKYIDSSDGNHELYDLEADPGESSNLVSLEPEVAGRLAAELAAYEAERGRAGADPDAQPIDEELRRKLEALGYIGS